MHIENVAPYHPLDAKDASEDKLRLNLKNKKIRDFVLGVVVPRVDIILEAYRPGVMERFGLEPESVHRQNPSLLYVRLSGYGH